MFSSIKTTNESKKTNDWLGLKDESSEEDEFPAHVPPKVESTISNLVKKNPIAPVQHAPPTVIEPPKKSVLDGFLEEDRRSLTVNTPIKPPIASNTTGPNLWFDEHTNTNKRPTTAGISNSTLFTDKQQVKSSTKPLFDTKNDFGIYLYF
jgi:hypothetical protein